MPENETNHFLSLMHDLTPDFAADIQPLKQAPTAQTSFKATRKGDVEAKRQAAQAQERKDPGQGLSDEVRVWIEPEASMGWHAPGIQTFVYKNLRLGKYGYELVLDMHKMRVEQARSEIASFIQYCYRRSVRSALVVHGKGSRNKTQPALLKSLCYQWLKDLPLVQAFHTALPKHGGAGATYIMIKKSEASKQETRERIQKRQL